MGRESVRERVLDALLTAGGPVGLQEATRTLRLPRSTVHRHLQELVRDGYLRAENRGKDVTYRPAPRLEVDWLGHREAFEDLPANWFRRTWIHPGEVDWRFPLVTALPDADGREAVLRFLQVCWARGMFQPWLLEGRRSPPPGWEGHQVVVFGSCARGDARRDSDVDVAVFETAEAAAHPPLPSQRPAFLEIADALNLGSPRYLDLHVFRNDDADTPDLPEGLLKEMRREGITVFTTADFIEASQRHLDAVMKILEGRHGG